jgi:regulator of sirC expression with transglutaminase-like and TPR domain
MRIKIFNIFFIWGMIILCVGFNVNFAFAQCGLPGTPPCAAARKTASKRAASKVKPKPKTTSLKAVPQINSLPAVEPVLMSPQDYFNRAQNCDKTNYDCRIASFTKAINLDPNYTDAYFSRGYNYTQKGNYDEAINDYNKVIELKPEYSLSYNNRGWVYYKKGNYDQAIIDANTSIRLDPNRANTYDTRGNAYLGKGWLNMALIDFSKAIELNPNQASYYASRAQIYRYLGEINPAVADERKVYELTTPQQQNIERRTQVQGSTTKAIPTSKEDNSPFSAVYVGGNRPPTVEIVNGTNRLMNMVLNGKLYKIVAGGSETVVLEPGTHSFSVSAVRVHTFSGSRTFDRGYIYTWRFFIK